MYDAFKKLKYFNNFIFDRKWLYRHLPKILSI